MDGHDGVRADGGVGDGRRDVELGLEAAGAAVDGPPGLRVILRVGARGQQGVQAPEVDVVRVPAVRLLPPALPGKGAQLLRQMGSVVEQRHLHAPVVAVLQQAHGGVVPMGDGVDLRRGQAQIHGQQGADGHAVADADHGASPVPGGDLLHHPPQPPLQVRVGLAALHAPGPGVVVEAAQQLRGLKAHVPEGAVLPDAGAHLPQPGLDKQRQLVIFQNGARGLLGPAQVAGVEGVHRDVPEALRQRRDLAAALGRDLAVGGTVDAPVEVALRLTVADQIDSGHVYPPFPALQQLVLT